MQSNLASIIDLIDHHDIDVLCLTETWLNKATPDEVVSIRGFDIYRRDRDSTQTNWNTLGGGGVAILCASHLSVRRRADLEHLASEMITLQINGIIISCM